LKRNIIIYENTFSKNLLTSPAAIPGKHYERKILFYLPKLLYSMVSQSIIGITEYLIFNTRHSLKRFARENDVRFRCPAAFNKSFLVWLHCLSAPTSKYLTRRSVAGTTAQLIRIRYTLLLLLLLLRKTNTIMIL